MNTRSTLVLVSVIVAVLALGLYWAATRPVPLNVTSIEPTSGVIGSNITIGGSGFTHDVYVLLERGTERGFIQPDSSGSNDLEFTVPATIDACLFPERPGENLCIDPPLQLRPGTYDVSTWRSWKTEHVGSFTLLETEPRHMLEAIPADDLASARKVLVSYFDLLSAKNYTEAKAYHGSGYEILRQWNPDIGPNDYETLLRHGCEENGWICISIKNIVEQKQTSPSEFEFVVQFSEPHGSTDVGDVFALGPCCDEADSGERTTDFTFRVVKTGTRFVVTTAPAYTP